MKISFKSLTVFILIAIFSLWLWYKFGYNQFLFIDLPVEKKEALAKAEAYLISLGVDFKGYRKAIVFNEDGWADRYLQKVLGVKKEEEFLKQHNYSLFYWHIRFFKELKKEEYNINISPKTAEVLAYNHVIEDVEARENISKELARQKAEEFFKKAYNINLQEYNLHGENAKRLELRTDYSFSWEKKGVYIPWENNQGGAKLLIGITVSGNEIRSFYINKLDIPEKFKRYINNKIASGGNLSSFTFILIAGLVIWSILTVIKRKHDLVIRLSIRPFVNLAAFLVILNVCAIFNNFQGVLMGYPTTVSLVSFFWLSIVRIFLSIGFASIVFIFTGLAGELLRNEQLPDAKYSCLLHYLKSTFFSRNAAGLIVFGYILFFIILGFQSCLFYFGQKYLGVWKELTSLTQFSSSYFPFLTAFIIGVNTSLNEEIIFRLFGISFGKKYLKNIILAVLFSSIVWGLCHTGYAIFPVWFRGIEVSLLGVIFCFIFLKYGLISVIVTHYLFNVFWGVAVYILGHSSAYMFFSSLAVLLFPLAFAAIAYFVNKEDKEKEIKIMLDANQKYNLGILVVFVSTQKNKGFDSETIKRELIKHNWDIDLVDLAIEEVFKE